MINLRAFAFEKKGVKGISIYESSIIFQLTVVAQMPACAAAYEHSPCNEDGSSMFCEMGYYLSLKIP